MTEVRLSVELRMVLDRVAHTTAYIGSKRLTAEDPGAFERVFATDEDRLLLQGYWRDAMAMATGVMRRFLVEASAPSPFNRLDLNNDYEVRLSMPSAFDSALSESMQTSLTSFFVAYIMDQWLRLVSPDAAEGYAADAAAHLSALRTTLYHRSKPKRKPINP